ncbi:MAG TPA: hypothetical protein VJQ44_02870 [Gemmatimonadales bacterium]|nr:hypothetical protein [Gemmatimonadales bacterium]
MLRPAAFLLLLLLSACARDRGDLAARRAALEAGFREARQAHFAGDARLLADGLDDTLESLDAGVRSAQPRDAVRAMFSRYFAGAAYRAWEYLEPPRVALSDDGSLATALQVVCVDREEPDSQEERRRRVFVTAYSSSYRWRDGRWRMQTVASTFEPHPPARCPATAPDRVARRVLDASARALGASRVQTLEAIASVQGPRRAFPASIRSGRDGRARLALGSAFLAGFGPQGAWMDQGGRVARADSVTGSVVRGHELHFLVLAPESRLRDPLFLGIQPWGGDSALAVSLLDELGTPAILYLGRRDTLPVGLRLRNQTGRGAARVEVVFDDWETVDGVRLFRRAAFLQGPDRYDYRYTTVRLNHLADADFEPR